jgi:hypothetical protein
LLNFVYLGLSRLIWSFHELYLFHLFLLIFGGERPTFSFPSFDCFFSRKKGRKREREIERERERERERSGASNHGILTVMEGSVQMTSLN